MKDKELENGFVSINIDFKEKSYTIYYIIANSNDFPDFLQDTKTVPDKFINEFNDIKNRISNLEFKLYEYDKKYRLLK